ncbi:hypothetical protein AOQ84DRAFT_326757 [Glonium stellatum]|uniref:Uncharacterized protein n=1 Tax=Glonium stellatum TaxID=574774 RepID=A0A8E2EQD9_9PEZI|nr:hypothetical protein AOQ84DRAFT_326757 [Glonium stellatum]
MFASVNCTQAPSETPSDAGVAGAGVLLSFIITNGLALGLSAYIIILNLRKSSEAKIVRKLLNSFSDQQIITGIGIQSVGLAKMETMVPYHFFIIWMLSLLSAATHLATLLALVNDFKRDWVLRWIRQFLMFINLILSCVFGIFVLKSVLKNLPPTLPIACVWNVPGKGTPSNAGISIAGTIVVIAGNCVIFAISTWYLHNRGSQKWLKIIQVVSLLVLTAIGVGAAIRVILLSQAFGSPSVSLSDSGEKSWSFGQLLPLLLLLLPILSAIELFRGEIKVTPSAVDDEHAPLFDGELQDRPPFPPNPFWGSRSNLFQK